MSNVLNVQLSYGLGYAFNYLRSVNDNWRATSTDSIVLRGTGVALDDQQHVNNQNNNYLSYRVKCIRLHGLFLARAQDVFEKDNLVVVLFCVPAKYETGVVRPAAKTSNFLTLKDYVLYSNPRCVLSWSVFTPHKTRWNGYYLTRAYDVSLSCDKEFVLGPNDLLCCNFLISFKGAASVTIPDIQATAKIYYDLN